MTSLAIALLVSLAIAAVILACSRGRHAAWHDHELRGVQKFHARPVPRVGGVCIAGGLSALVCWVGLTGRGPHAELLLVLLCGLPAFAAGLLEDLTKRVSATTRLAATMVSGAMAFFMLDAQLKSVELPVLDWLMNYTVFSLAFTMIATGGVANAVNIIDGYNGLTAVVVSVMLLSLSYVGWQVGDNLVVSVALAGTGALMGFFVWNWPRGLIFLGDGGAYFLGYLVAVLSFLLVSRHANEVSPWYPLLLAIYPVFETLFSIWRKRIVRGHSPGIPDGLHLHMLVFRRLVRWAVGRRDAASLTLRNSLTAPYLWLLSSLAALPATLFWRQPTLLKLFVAVFCVLYVWLYLSLVRFRAPRWLMVRGRRGGLLSRFKDDL
ncbi:MraY family glycosyltransferase [Caldimonas sp. KR1-144]|uniref:MraY family glycosyltransferase n=1 Tax=Caldimonas sp. KR1-144 TaxID=3400911 RepID=UPI003BFFB87E